jgi:ADP-ribosylglycohydrolase
MEIENLLEKFQGCIIGKCVGDALGFIVEGQNQEYCTNYVETYVKNLKPPQEKRGEFTFGQYSDDSQLARELMLSLVERKRFDPEDYASKIAEMFKNDKMVGRGHATNNAATRLIDGISWEESGEGSPYAGNGTAMRVAPIGLFFYKNPALLEIYAMQQGTITHKDERCSAGSLTIALAITYVLTNERIDPNELLDAIIPKVKNISELFAEELENLKEWMKLPFEEALVKISISGKPELENYYWDKIPPYVVPTVICSLYAFLKNTTSFIDAIGTAIRVGGDVDTTAAITGALSGTYLGIKAIPEEYSQVVNDQGTWGYMELMKLAEDVYTQVQEN